MKSDYSRDVVENYVNVRSCHVDIQELIISELIVNSDLNFADLACGPCTETYAISKKCGFFVGIDKSLDMLCQAREQINGSLVCSNLDETIPLNNESIDSMVMIAGIHHIRNIDGFFAEAFRVLRSSGRFLLITNTPEQILKREYYSYFPGLLQSNIKRFRSIDVLKSNLEKSGFLCDRKGFIIRDNAYFDRSRLKRLSTGALDSATWFLSKKEWQNGLIKLQSALARGVKIRHCRDRAWICGRK